MSAPGIPAETLRLREMFEGETNAQGQLEVELHNEGGAWHVC